MLEAINESLINHMIIAGQLYAGHISLFSCLWDMLRKFDQYLSSVLGKNEKLSSSDYI